LDIRLVRAGMQARKTTEQRNLNLSFSRHFPRTTQKTSTSIYLSTSHWSRPCL